MDARGRRGMQQRHTRFLLDGLHALQFPGVSSIAAARSVQVREYWLRNGQVYSIPNMLTIPTVCIGQERVQQRYVLLQTGPRR